MATIQCEQPQMRSWYQRLRRDGVKDADIDQGYGQAVATEDPFAPDRIVMGANDGVIHCAEIAEAVFVRYAKYQALIAKDTGRPVPWLAHGALARQLTKAATLIRRDVESVWGQQPYARVLLDHALYLYARMPPISVMPYYRQYQADWLARSLAPMRQRGLDQVAALIEREGGLGLASFTQDTALEATVDESIDQQKGACTERAKALFALFTAAGREPFIYDLSVPQAEKAWNAAFATFGVQFTPTPEEETQGHVVLADEIDGEVLSFDFQPVNSNQTLILGNLDRFGERISLREFFLQDLSNLVLQQVGAGQLENAKRTLASARALGPSFFDSHFSYDASQIALTEKNFALAKQEIDAGLDRLPNSPNLATQRCTIDALSGDRTTALTCLTTLSTPTQRAQMALVDLYIAAERWADAEPLLRRLYDAGTERPMTAIKLGHVLMFLGRAPEAIPLLEAAARALPADPLPQIGLGLAYREMKQWTEASRHFERGILLSPGPQPPENYYGLLGEALAQQGEILRARHYALRWFAGLRISNMTQAIQIHRDARETALRCQVGEQLAAVWTRLLGSAPPLAVLVMDLEWRQGQTTAAMARAERLPILAVSEAFATTPAHDVDLELIRTWDAALQVLPDEFWPQAPQALVAFYHVLGRWYEETGRTADAIRATELYLAYHRAPEASARERLARLKR